MPIRDGDKNSARLFSLPSLLPPISRRLRLEVKGERTWRVIANRPASRWSELSGSLPLQFNDYTVFCFSAMLEIVASVSCSPKKNREPSLTGRKRREKGGKYLETNSRVESALGNRNQPAITPITKSFSPTPFVHCSLGSS